MTEIKVIRQSVRATWRGGQKYEVTRENAPPITIDGDQTTELFVLPASPGAIASSTGQ